MSMMMAAALALAEKGLHVFACRERAKEPATARGVLEATTDQFTIRQWYAANPRFNVAVATGPQSGIFALDIDDGGEAELAKLEAAHGALPASVETITGGGGRHVLFRYPEGCEVHNSAGRLGLGLDVRGLNGYIIAPPSTHASGRAYAWSVDSAATFAEAPPWLLGLVAATGNGKAAAPPSEWRTLVHDGVAEGLRNASAARLAGHLLRHGVDPHVTHELLQAWNATRCNPPLTEQEVARTVNSICARELKRRGL